MSSEVEFIEDKNYPKPPIRINQDAKKGFEGWIYSKLPGSVFSKHLIVITIIIIIFAVSLFIFILFVKSNFRTDYKVEFKKTIDTIKLI